LGPISRGPTFGARIFIAKVHKGCRAIDKQTDKQTDRQTDRQTDIHIIEHRSVTTELIKV
jgi:hypothetical protein